MAFEILKSKIQDQSPLVCMDSHGHPWWQQRDLVLWAPTANSQRLWDSSEATLPLGRLGNPSHWVRAQSRGRKEEFKKNIMCLM
jgi:hypothetical protein